MSDLKQQMRQLAERSRAAARRLATMDSAAKTAALHAMADGIQRAAPAIIAANVKDLEAGKKNGLSAAVLDRLALNEKRLADMAKAVREIAELPDPVGRVLREWQQPNGLQLQKVSVPIGVILMIYEARPNVTSDAAALCIRTGNAVILRGGSEALHSNMAVAEAMTSALSGSGLPAATGLSAVADRAKDGPPTVFPPDAVTVVPTCDRAAVDELLKLDDLIQLCIPRGGESLIRAVAEKSRIPVIKHYKGICHVYVDRDADLDMAEKIVVNAKCQRPGTCNAMETLLVDAPIAGKFLPRIEKALGAKQVKLRCDAPTMKILCGRGIPAPTGRDREVAPTNITPATEADWYAEYLDLILAVRVVNGVDEAIAHITQYGSAHSDAIVTGNETTARKFLREVDSSSVFWNASTRLADGGVYGFGAEIGISTDKLHARGPMGLEDLTTYKYVVTGNGQVRE